MTSEREKALEAALRSAMDRYQIGNISIGELFEELKAALAIPTDDKRSTSSAGDSEPPSRRSTMNETLKPCPFCGSVAELRSEGKHYFVACTDEDECGVEGHRARVYDHAIETWNYRTAAEQVRAPAVGVEALERFEVTYDSDIGMIHRPHPNGYYVRYTDASDALRSTLTGASAVGEADTKRETYYSKGKDAEYFERLPNKELAWALTCASQDLNDSDENVSAWMPVSAMLSSAADRISAAPVQPGDEWQPIDIDYLRETLAWVRRNFAGGSTRQVREQIDLALEHLIAAPTKGGE